MSSDERIEAALGRRPADEPDYSEPLTALIKGEGVQRRPVRPVVRPRVRPRTRTSVQPALLALAVVVALGATAVAVGVWRSPASPVSGSGNDYQLTGRFACYGQGPGGTIKPGMASDDCPHMAVPPDGYGAATWTLDPSVPYSAGATEIHVLVDEWGCHSSQSAEGRIAQNVQYRDDAVIVTLAVRLPSGDFQTCPGTPPTPFVVRIAQPVGSRDLNDGGRWPAYTVARGGLPVVSPSAALPSAASPSAASPSGVVVDTTSPAPPGMLPLGPTESLNQPPASCSPGIPGVGAPVLYAALPAAQLRADPQPAGVGEVVNYDWGGHRPVAADSLHATVPNLNWTLRLSVSRMRMVVATSNGICFAQWRATARTIEGYDGAQDGGGWALLGEGVAASDAVVIEGLPEGDWIVHVHLSYEAQNATGTHTSESYFRVIVGGRIAVQPASVPAPDPAAKCAGASLQPGHTPQVELKIDGPAASTTGIRGTIDTGQGGAGIPASIPTDVIAMTAGELFTIRTADGTCGNDWSGMYFLAVPDALDGPIAGLSGLPSNNGTPPNVATPQLVGAITGRAPAPGEWLVGVALWFGGPIPVDYYWRISVH